MSGSSSADVESADFGVVFDGGGKVSLGLRVLSPPKAGHAQLAADHGNPAAGGPVRGLQLKSLVVVCQGKGEAVQAIEAVCRGERGIVIVQY